MRQKPAVLLVFAVFALCLVGCDDDDEKSVVDFCKDECSKIYDECAEEYMGENDVLEDELAELLETCLEDCEPNEETEECAGWYACYDDAYNKAGLSECNLDISSEWNNYEDCRLGLECDDYFAGQGCEDEYQAAQDAQIDATQDCENAMGELTANELEALADAWAGCDDEYDCNPEY